MRASQLLAEVHNQDKRAVIGGGRWSWGPSGWALIAEDMSATEEDRAQAREALAALRKPRETTTEYMSARMEKKAKSMAKGADKRAEAMKAYAATED
jgi:hypothetical protein